MPDNDPPTPTIATITDNAIAICDSTTLTDTEKLEQIEPLLSDIDDLTSSIEIEEELTNCWDELESNNSTSQKVTNVKIILQRIRVLIQQQGGGSE